MTVIRQNKIDILVGMIAPFGMSSVPTGWLACDGSAVSRTTYADLFTAIGTTWGAGDGSSTFALPDLEGAFLRGVGAHNTSNKADGSDFGDASRAVGSFENDQFQGHQHQLTKAGQEVGENSVSGSGYIAVNKDNTDFAGNRYKATTIEAFNDGTPREGDETRPFNAGVKYCIKY
jgi:microcystin-dependent protein